MKNFLKILIILNIILITFFVTRSFYKEKNIVIDYKNYDYSNNLNKTIYYDNNKYSEDDYYEYSSEYDDFDDESDDKFPDENYLSNEKDNFIQKVNLSKNLKDTEHYKNIFYNYVEFKNKKLSKNEIKKIINKTYDLSKKYDIDFLIALSIINTESEFDIKATNKYAKGIMQINDNIWFSEKNTKYNLIHQKIFKNKNEIFDVEKNIEAGFYILNHYKNVCLEYKDKNILNKLGYDNIFNCMLNKYNGIKNNKYYDNVKKSIGEILFFIIDKNKNI